MYGPLRVLQSYYTATFEAGADPERNLTRARPKACRCGYMGVAMSIGSYKHDLVDAAQLSA